MMFIRTLLTCLEVFLADRIGFRGSTLLVSPLLLVLVVSQWHHDRGPCWSIPMDDLLPRR